jgi:AAA+ superfamily predicted ATPase
VVTALVTKVDVVVNWMSSLIHKTYTTTSYWAIKAYNSHVRRKVVEPKTCVISLITEGRDINELYIAVEWYLTSNLFVDYSKETPINISFNKKIENLTENEDIKLSQSINFGQSKKILFKNMEIWFTFTSEVISIFVDKERKKENKKITLTALINQTQLEQHVILTEFCQHCVSEYRKFIKTKAWIPYVFVNRSGEWIKSALDNKRCIDSIILKNDRQLAIKEDLRKFLNNGDFYQEIGIPYKRGYLFYGVPGTGKTSMIKAISNFTKRDVYYVNLNDINNDNELFELMHKIPNDHAIVVFEDIDCATNIVQKRDKQKDRPCDNDDKVVEGKTTPTLTGLFNVIDGVFDAYGRILIMTTNHPETLDKALYRAGRIDMKIEFGNCDRQQIAKMFHLYYKRECDTEKLVKIIEDKYSPAHVSTLFMSHISDPDTVLDHIDDDYIEFEKSTISQIDYVIATNKLPSQQANMPIQFMMRTSDTK